jgi:fido (protein-threonine AMPylation protein)
MQGIAHKWEPITDLPDDYTELSDPAFGKLGTEWFSARKIIKNDLFESFKEKVNREWAIETGQVERLYNFNDNLTKTMIENGLDSVELPHQDNGLGFMETELVIANHYDVINSLYEEITTRTSLSHYFIRGLHAVLVQNQDYAPGIDAFGRRARMPLLKGDYKKWPNSPHTKDGLIHQYCPPEQVSSEMGRLLEMHTAHVLSDVPVDIEAAWLHHRFIQIHPFQDGNGRVSRALASLEYVRAGFLPPVVTAARKPEYLDALDQANKGNLKPFVRHLSSLVMEKTKECIAFAHVMQKTELSDTQPDNDAKQTKPKPHRRHKP